MSPPRKAPVGALAGAVLAGAFAATFIAWHLHMQAMNAQIAQKRSALEKLAVSGRIPPNQDVMDYLTAREATLQDRYRYWETLVVAPLSDDNVRTDPQLYFQEQLHDVQGTLERLAKARGLATPEQLGFPKELPPSDTVPRLLVQLALIEDVAKLVLTQGVTSLSSFKVDDPETIAERDSEQSFLMRLPVRVRLGGPLPVIMKVLGALQHARPIIDVQGVRMATGSSSENVEAELVVSRYLVLASPRGSETPEDNQDAAEPTTRTPTSKPRRGGG